VCPECGAPAGESPFCASCGTNLTRVARLPSAEEWQAAHAAQPDATRPVAAGRGHRGRRRVVIGAGVTILVVVGIVLAAFILRPDASTRYRVPSGSMLPTLKIGESLRVRKGSYSPAIGDIVVFHPPTGAEGTGDTCGDPNRASGQACDKPTSEQASVLFIKRVVGLPGDRLSIVNGHVIRDGKREADGYIAACAGGSACNLPRTITVPADHYFMLGDNRGESDDSRFWGPVPRSAIVGPVVTCGVLSLRCNPRR
jgi:signal peptidase I